jgi:hypothetical protein
MSRGKLGKPSFQLAKPWNLLVVEMSVEIPNFDPLITDILE